MLLSLVVFCESQLSALPFVVLVLLQSKSELFLLLQSLDCCWVTQINLGVVFLFIGIKGTCRPNSCGAANTEVWELCHLFRHSFLAGCTAERCVLTAHHRSVVPSSSSPIFTFQQSLGKASFHNWKIQSKHAVKVICSHVFNLPTFSSFVAFFKLHQVTFLNTLQLQWARWD